MNIGILASGNLGLHTILESKDLFEPCFIATDRSSLSIIEYANENNIPLFVGNPRNGKLFQFLSDIQLEVIISVNYLFLIEKEIIGLVKYPINLHGSLLPKYRGRTPHVWSIINNEKQTGVTAHFIDEDCDTGDIILQTSIEIKYDYTGADILKEYFLVYPQMIKEIINSIQQNNLSSIKQDNSKATYFGKRTPSDGEINWEWQRERIRNWVRAQSDPYPGAFTFLENEKIVIDKIEFSDMGFHWDLPNGTIIQLEPSILVKTSNGVIELVNIRSERNILVENKILGK